MGCDCSNRKVLSTLYSGRGIYCLHSITFEIQIDAITYICMHTICPRFLKHGIRA